MTANYMSTLDRGWLMNRVAGMVDDEGPIDPAEDLTLYGLDSVAVMQLVAELERRGVPVTFEDLAREATVDAWWALIDRRART